MFIDFLTRICLEFFFKIFSGHQGLKLTFFFSIPLGYQGLKF